MPSGQDTTIVTEFASDSKTARAVEASLGVTSSAS